MSGWLKYNLCDSSGWGIERDNYIHAPSLPTQANLQEVKEFLEWQKEPWLQHAESFRLRYKQNVPLEQIPLKVLTEKRKELFDRIVAAEKEFQLNSSQILDREKLLERAEKDRE